MIEDIRRKSFTAGLPLSDRQVMSPDLMRTFLRACREIAPLLRFLADAVRIAW